MTDARRYDRHPFVTGTVNYSTIQPSKIRLIDVAPGRIYFIRTASAGGARNRHFFTGKERHRLTSRWIGDARTWSTAEAAWRSLIMDAANITSRYVPDAFTLCAFDPMTESEYEIDLPEWKHRTLRWISQYVAPYESRSNVSSLVGVVIKADSPLTVGEVTSSDIPGWAIAKKLEGRMGKKARAARHFLFFSNEEDAVMAALISPSGMRLIKP